ncbi:MAG: carboxypeptidase-like regulatory domain-containing protein [Spirochaetia bacterium]|jgi:hypothetical protein
MIRRSFIGSVLALGILALVVLGACTITVTKDVPTPVTATPTGYVIDAKLGAALGGATVSLTHLDTGGTDYTATSSTADGSYSFSNVTLGNYTLSATLSGYTFTTQTVQISGTDQQLPNTGGFLTVDSLTVVVFWDRSFADVDSYLTAPSSDCGTSTGLLASDGSDFYTAQNTPPDGFFPSTTVGVRTTVFYNNKIPAGFLSNSIFLDVDNRGAPGQTLGGPETLTINLFPWNHTYTGANIYKSTGTSDPSVLPAGSYEWVGVLEYYLDAFNSVYSTTADSTSMLASVNGVTNTANPVVYVFYGTSQLARYTLPQFTNIKTASILRVNMFMDSTSGEWFQVIPDTKVYASNASVKGTSDRGIFVVRGGHK